MPTENQNVNGISQASLNHAPSKRADFFDAAPEVKRRRSKTVPAAELRQANAEAVRSRAVQPPVKSRHLVHRRVVTALTMEMAELAADGVEIATKAANRTGVKATAKATVGLDTELTNFATKAVEVTTTRRRPRTVPEAEFSRGNSHCEPPPFDCDTPRGERAPVANRPRKKRQRPGPATIRSPAIPPPDDCTPPSESQIDWREQLFNNGEIGPITHVQVSTERIVTLRGILFDLDPKLIRMSTLIPHVPSDPAEFYQQIVQPRLSRHSVLSRLEIRNSGTGIHAILRLADPPTFNTDEERKRWTGIVQVVQASLPIDTDQPHITALTRPLGSINSKNGATVTLLAQGEPVSSDEVVVLYDEMRQAPFKLVMQNLFGINRIKPCPVCNKAGSELTALDRVGQCYGSCGKVMLAQLYDLVLTPRDSTVAEGGDHAAK